MKKRLVDIIFLLFLTLSSLAQAQGPRRVAGELIVQLEAQLPASKLDGYSLRSQNGLYSLDYSRCLSRTMHIYLFRFDPALIGNATIRQIAQIPGVNWVQYNHYLDSRAENTTTPNDSQFGTQWNLNNTGQNGGIPDADVDAVEAWDLTTGGLSSNGDSLVIAIVDDGFDLGHSDLKFWKNRQEIPNNGLDDDNNGYIDDYDGWNGVSSSGSIPSSQHGTHVAGIAAARGDNGFGVSGVNWGLQIMPVIATPGTEADAVEAYSYILDMRRLYDQSNGAKGAYVVATNSSFGINNADPANFPLWCAMYDSLGHAGILSSVSTANSGVNVDVAGDIPSTCGSEYMIAVTASNSNDQRSGGAAYGPVSIDLAAPGVDILSTVPSSSFGSQTGTSMAAPHVGGAVALLMSYASSDFLQLYQYDPAATALLLRDLIFAGVDTLSDLQGEIATGGRLNLFKSLQLLDSVNASLSMGCLPPTLLGNRATIDTSATLFWQPITASSPYQVRYRALGSSSWLTLVANDTFLNISTLQACTDYEFQVAPACAPAGNYVFRHQFRTEGCCEAPQGLAIAAATDSSLAIRWDGVFGADEYRLQYRVLSSMNWVQTLVNDTSFTLTGLNACTAYEVRVGSICDTIENAFSASIQSSTGNCGCTGDAYCTIGFGSAGGEWIDSVQIGDFAYQSGSNNGYGYFPNLCFSLSPDSTYAVRLEPGYASFNFREAWRIWLDLNQDGDFNDANELIFDPNVGSDTVINGSITIPLETREGPTRMRIGMQFAGFSGINTPESCDSPDFGEFEDYCVTILPANQTCSAPCQLQLSQADTTTSLKATWLGDPTDTYRLRYRVLDQNDWQYLTITDTTQVLSGLQTCTVYAVGIQTLCGADSSLFGPTDTLSTLGCTTPIEPEEVLSINIYPNPFSDQLVVETEQMIQAVEVYDLQSKMLRRRVVSSRTVALALGDLADGLYVLRVVSLRGTMHFRVIKQ